MRYDHAHGGAELATTTLNTVIDPALKRRLRVEAHERTMASGTQVSMAAIIDEALRAYFPETAEIAR